MGRAALVLLLCGVAGLAACGGGGGNPGECFGSLEVCSEGREGADVATPTNSGVGGFSPEANPSAPPTGEVGPIAIPVNAGN